jgi:hypothetical protein
MHQRLADRRVNWVNRRREFFYVTPAEAKEHLLALAGEILEYVDEPEALEYRQSVNQARQTSSGPQSEDVVAPPSVRQGAGLSPDGVAPPSAA